MTSNHADATEREDRHAARTGIDMVTGAFSYSGSAIADALIASGRKVRTLTGHPDRSPRGTSIDVRPLAFDDPQRWWQHWRA